MTMQIVRFVSKAGKYNAGDVAGFSPHEAKRYLEAGKAVSHDPNPPVAAEPVEKVVESDKSEQPESGNAESTKPNRSSKKRVRSMEAGEGKVYETKDE